MANTLLSDLYYNVRRLFYTIDDCYADPTVLQWQQFMDELQEDLEALQTLVPKSKNTLQLIQKYYLQFVDVAAMLQKADGDIEDLKEKIAFIQANVLKNQEFQDNIDQAKKNLEIDIKKNDEELQKYKRLNKEIEHEQTVLTPLTDKVKYKKIYKEIEQQAAQYNIGILECEANITNIYAQIEALTKDKIGLAQDAANMQAQIADLEAEIAKIALAKTQATQQSDFQDEKNALAYLERFFKLITKYKNKETGEDFSQIAPTEYIIHQNTLPKNWRNLLQAFCKARLPQIAGILQKNSSKKNTDAYPQLVRTTNLVTTFESTTVRFSPQSLLASAMLGLQNALNQKQGIQFDDCAYIPVSPMVVAKVTFREKGRIVAAFSAPTVSEDAENIEDESEYMPKMIEIFVRSAPDTTLAVKQIQTSHKDHFAYSIADLYILFDKYVLEIDFMPQW
jgi:hypothetical protein